MAVVFVEKTGPHLTQLSADESAGDGDASLTSGDAGRRPGGILTSQSGRSGRLATSRGSRAFGAVSVSDARYWTEGA